MSCAINCGGSCSCNGTIRSRRCECASSPGLINRDQTFCGNNQLFNPVYHANNELSDVEVYGSGLSKFSLNQLENFNTNISQQRKYYMKKYYRGNF